MLTFLFFDLFRKELGGPGLRASLTLPSCSPTIRVHPELDERTLDIVHSLTIATQNNKKKTNSVEEKSFLMQYHSL